jgi:hypothetical protein
LFDTIVFLIIPFARHCYNSTHSFSTRLA